MSEKLSVRETVAEWTLGAWEGGGGGLWSEGQLIAALPDRAFEYMAALRDRAREEA